MIFKPICRLSNFFHFKVRIPLELRSHVVYQFTCQCCNALYLGKTCRHLHTRISEHCGISALTGKLALFVRNGSTGFSVQRSSYSIISCCLYYLKNEQQCFIRFKTTSAARASGFRPDKTRDASYLNGFKNVYILLHRSLYKNLYIKISI